MHDNYSAYAYYQVNVLQSICAFNSPPQKSIKLSQSQLITGIGDIIQIYMRYSLDARKRHIMFNFRIVNMTPFSMEHLTIDFERNLSMVAKPYPETSKHVYIEQLSVRGVQEWNCLFLLNDYTEM